MGQAAPHTFHTRHDFTPELGWAAFQLMREFGAEGIEVGQLESAARTTTSPLARRADLTKILASLVELGLVARNGKAVPLTALGFALADGLGAYETGFRAAVHCLFAWQWLLGKDESHASPSWSYREVCRHLLGAPPSGVTADELVIRVVEAAGRFGAERVSFSRSSVAGVTTWLRAQSPPLVEGYRRAILRARGQPPAPSLLRLNLAALCALEGGRAPLEGGAMDRLAESLLVPPDELWLPAVEYARESKEFCFVQGGKGLVVFQGSADPFVRLIALGAAGRDG